jgi:gliding motility-associated-like protein
MATATGVNCVDANNGTVTAAVSGGTPGYRYLWDDPLAQTTPTAIRLFAGTYTVVVTDTNNCTVTASATVGEPVTREPQITISIDHNPVCRGTRVHFTSNVVFSGPDPVYQWIKNGVSVGSNDSVYSDSTLQDKDVINCILTSSEPCAIPATKVSDGIRINVKDPPDAAFTITTLNGNPTGRIQLNNYSTGADAYQWDFGNGQTSAEENPTVSYTQDGDYLIRLVALDDYSCSDTAYNKHLVEFFGLYIPNAFAPESGVYPANVFKPAGANLKQYRIEVYDSWGYLLWESTALDSEGSPLESWDGTYRGKLMPQGTYMWKVNAIFNDGRIWQGCDVGKGMGKTIGTVTLIR